MRVVIDTNVLLTAVFPKSKNHWIRKALEKGQLELCVTTDVLDEYAEIFESYYDFRAAEIFMSVLELLPMIRINKYFFLRLMPNDEDDEKFVDCAFAAGSEFLVTNDKDFGHLKKLAFPKLNIIDENQFLAIFEQRFGTTE